MSQIQNEQRDERRKKSVVVCPDMTHDQSIYSCSIFKVDIDQ